MDAAGLKAVADEVNAERLCQRELSFDEILKLAEEAASLGRYHQPFCMERKDEPPKDWVSEETKIRLKARGFQFTEDRFCEYGRLSYAGIRWDNPTRWERFLEWL